MVPSYETYRDYREGKLFPSIGKAMVAAAKVNWFGAIYTFTQTSEGVLLQMAKDQSNKIEKSVDVLIDDADAVEEKLAQIRKAMMSRKRTQPAKPNNVMKVILGDEEYEKYLINEEIRAAADEYDVPSIWKQTDILDF